MLMSGRHAAAIRCKLLDQLERMASELEIEELKEEILTLRIAYGLAPDRRRKQRRTH